MYLLLIQLLEEADYVRQTFKLSVAILATDLAFLILMEIVAVAASPHVFSSAVAITGCLWIIITAATIWFCGGQLVDALGGLSLLGAEPGKAVLDTVRIFFLLESTVVAFFFFLPVYKFWPGVFILPVLLIGLIISGNLAKKPWNWNAFWGGYWTLILFVVGVMLILAVTPPKIKAQIRDAFRNAEFKKPVPPPPQPPQPQQQSSHKENYYHPKHGSATSGQTTPTTSVASSPKTKDMVESVESVESTEVVLPANELVTTNLRYEPGDKIRLNQLVYPPIIYAFVSDGRSYSISRNPIVLRVTPPDKGFVCLEGGNWPTKVEVRVTHAH